MELGGSSARGTHSFSTQAQWARQKLGNKLDLESPRLVESPRGAYREHRLRLALAFVCRRSKIMKDGVHLGRNVAQACSAEASPVGTQLNKAGDEGRKPAQAFYKSSGAPTCGL